MDYKPEELISSFLVDPDSMTQEQADAFSEWIKQKPEHGRLFIRSSLLHRGIHEYFCSADISSTHLLEDELDDDSGDSQMSFEKQLWAQLSRQERDAPTVEIEKEENAEIKPQESDKAEPVRRVYPKGYLLFSAISIAATVLLFAYVWTHPRHIPQDVATVMDIYRAKWSDPGIAFQKGTRLFDDRKPLHLVEGVVKVQFDNGVQVVIEGPSEFSLEEYEHMGLEFGKLYAKVPAQAIGFRVNTPNCGVIDLGTEFGVNVTDRGETNVHLFKGKASLVTSSEGQAQQSFILQRHEAKRVDVSGDIRPITFQDREFVRDFDSAQAILWNGEGLSLASIVAGGNGMGRVTRNAGIDQETGELVSGVNEERGRQAPEGYVPVPGLSFVDGVFVPDGEKGPVQLTSEGHLFDEFQDTNGQYYMTIGAYSLINMYMLDNERRYTSIHLEGYPEETSVNLCLHANSGITFDLQRIRESMPFAHISGFSSVYGVPKTRDDQTDVASSFYVFVDGQPRMIEHDVSNQDEPGRIAVPLEETDRFLTLVCTDGGNNFGDWSVFVDPTLELELAD